MKWIIFAIWALTSDNYFKQNLFAAKVSEMVFGMPVSVQFAQAIYESGTGRSYIAIHSNNHFGIKYYPSTFWGGSFTDRGGTRWRLYPTIFVGYIDHAYFIWDHYPAACFGSYLRFKQLYGYGEAGYWGKIVSLIQSQKLYKYDNINWR
jgi:hypothetical protein